MKIFILGYPKSGKTKYSNRFENVIHLDDLIKDFNFKEQANEGLKIIKEQDNYVVEGIQCFRILRKILKQELELPNKIIYIKTKYPAYDNHIKIRKSLDKIWYDCLALDFDKDIYVSLLVSNKGKKTSKLKYVKSSIEASFDEVYVGYRATKDYFADLLNGQEQTLFLKSGHSESLVLSRLKPGQICGGIVRLDKEKYSELDLKMQVLDAEYPSLMDVDKVHNYTFAFFPTSYKTIDIQYDFKGIKEITIGGYPFFEDTLNKIILKGNYGVLYKVGIFLNNESNEYKNLSLVFSPSSGIIKGVMILNKGILETEFFQGQYHNNLEEFYKEIIAPGEQKKIEFYIMPQAGSFYPINIVLNNNKEIKYNY